MALFDSEPPPRSGAAGPAAPAVQPRPRWRDALPTVATIVAVAVFVAAGTWQRGRMDAKQALRAQLDAARVMPEAALPDGVDWHAWRYRPVRAEGTFDAARQFLVDNRVQGGRVGYHVVTPLALADGRVVLVNRGWVAAGATRDLLPAVPPAMGPVVVSGRVALPTAGYVELTADDGAGTVRQNLDPARFAAATGIRVLPIVIEATAPAAAEDAALVLDWPLPDAGADKHRIYMMQWYAFAALAAGLWLFFFVRRRRARPDGPGTGAGSPSP